MGKIVTLRNIAIAGAALIASGAYVRHINAGANFSGFKDHMEGLSTVMRTYKSNDGEWLGLWRVGNRSSWNEYERSLCDMFTISDDGSTVIIMSDGRNFSLGRPSWGNRAPRGTISLSIGGADYGDLDIKSTSDKTNSGLTFVNATLPTSFFGTVGKSVQFWSQLSAGGDLTFRFAGETVTRRVDPLTGNFARGSMKECYDLLERFE
ncbi:MAG: hypothetical protein ACTHKQ_25690 [Mesorhizobium sp.]